MGRLTETLLKNTHAYLMVQRIIGADRVRYYCLDLLAPKAGDRLLDVGCGPAYYVGHLPKVEYYGFDTDQTYIDYARAHFGHRGKFFCELFSERHLEELPRMNGVLLMGLLHHLDDAQSSELLELLGRALAPGGRVITVDPCFENGESRIRHLVAASDRGQFVRFAKDYMALAESRFHKVDGEMVGHLCRVPSNHWVMTLSDPTGSAKP